MPTLRPKPTARRVTKSPARATGRPAAPPAKEPRVHAYARGVVAGEILAGRFVRMACERHLADLARAGFDDHGRPLPASVSSVCSVGTYPAPALVAPALVWRADKAEAWLIFFESVLHLEENTPFILHDFQAFIIGSLFGWYRADGFRRFRNAYVEIGKGNGKTPLAAGIGLGGLTLDRETAPEIYSAAVSKDQAAICFKDAKMMVEASPELRRRLALQVGSITNGDGVFRPLSSEANNLDGKRVHIGIIDELHAHPDGTVQAKIRAGTKRRQNALILEITNSGFGRTSVCRQHHESSVRILEGTAQNDAWFAYVCTLDPCPACLEKGLDQPDENCPACDDWRDPAAWKKANPGLDTILPASYLREQIGTAATVPTEANLIKRLNFCLWTEQSVRWINMAKWTACGRSNGRFDTRENLLAALRTAPCKAAIDGASVGDFFAFVLEFDLGGGFYATLPFLFIPEDNLPARVDATGIRFDQWRDEGHLFTTPGNIVDYDAIRAHILRLGALYQISEIAFDPYNVTQLITQLTGDGYQCVPVRQGFLTLNAPSKAIEKLVLTEKLLHFDHPVLRWMASNCAASGDSAGNIKPDKEKSSEKIDGIVALIMAHDRFLRAAPPENSGDAGAIF